MSRDLQRLARQLGHLEDKARSLEWNAQRPWRPQTHIWTEKLVPMVDLHDLSIRLALEALEGVVEVAGEMDCGAVCLVTGRGRHSVDGRSRLREAVQEEAHSLCRERGWVCRDSQPGRLILVMDAARAPAWASGGLGLAVWIGIAAFLGLAVFVAPMVGIPLVLLAALIWWLG